MFQLEGSSETVMLQLESVTAGPSAEQVPLCSATRVSLPAQGETLLPSASLENAASPVPSGRVSAGGKYLTRRQSLLTLGLADM